MLIALIHTVAGEMLCRSSASGTLCAADIGPPAGFHPLGVAAKGTHVGNGVMGIHVDIHIRGKGKIAPNSRRLLTGYLTQMLRVADGIVRCSHLHIAAVRRAFQHQPVSAAFQICSQQQWHAGVFLQIRVSFVDLFCRTGTEQNSTHMRLQKAVQILGPR